MIPFALPQIRQAGASGSSRPDHIPYGCGVERGGDLPAAGHDRRDPVLGLRWSVVESLPVSEAIKLGEGNLASLFDNYRQSLRNWPPAASPLFATISWR